MTYKSFQDLIPNISGTVVHVVDIDIDELREKLVERKFAIYVIEGSSLESEEHFFKHVKNVFEFGDNFGYGWASWDDSLGDFAHTCPQNIAVIWKDANYSFNTIPQTFLQATCDMNRLAYYMAVGMEEGARVSKSYKQLELFILL